MDATVKTRPCGCATKGRHRYYCSLATPVATKPSEGASDIGGRLETTGKKLCKECLRELPRSTEFFTRRAAAADGFEYICRLCLSKRRKGDKTRGQKSKTSSLKGWTSARREEIKAMRREHHAKNRDAINEYQRKKHRDLRLAALLAYGMKCNCPGCGETTEEFLGIDHVKNDGNIHRSMPSDLGGVGGNIYYWLKKHNYPKDGRFQILCHNCNIGKARCGGVCPHERKLRASLTSTDSQSERSDRPSRPCPSVS